MTPGLTAQLIELASDWGAATVGVATAEPFKEERQGLRTAVAEGRGGPLGFTYDDPESATDLQRSFPWARRIVVVGWDYLGDAGHPAAEGALVARFATADHYAGVRKATESVTDRLRDLGYRAETLIDDNRLVDRGAAVRAGIGWWGRSTMVLAPGHGPWMLIGSVVTDAPLETTAPMTRDCGTCDLCIPACPTAAIGPSGLDARRCLSTWLQTPGSIPQWIRPKLGRRIYGCDECLVACPPGRPALSRTEGMTTALKFESLLAMSDEDLLDRFAWWFVPRRQGRFLRRNLLVAAGNSGEPATFRLIVEHLAHPSSMIRAHAYWALARGFGREDLLRTSLETETVRQSRDELLLALLMVTDPGLHRVVVDADEWARGDADIRALALTGCDGPIDGPLELLAVAGAAGSADPGREWEAARLTIRAAHDLETVDDPIVMIYDPDRILESIH
ncbi:MAG: tRNA epoxyqueuosine(34) reductase QueG [Acidimicrobiia bacterium]